ncbi:MAG TPA: IPT/TIG domain-containing protein [Puia sp.]|nr:IPT/TIG domain-containing protein [Puia sp.]
MKLRSLNIAAVAGLVLPLLGILTIASCKKYTYQGYTPGSGAPTVTSIHTYNFTDSTPLNDTIVSYNSSGQPTFTINAVAPRPAPLDSVVTAGNLGTYYLIEGSNLGSAVSVTFNGYSAYFNNAYSTDHSILVQVPTKTPYLGAAANDSLVITTTHGVARYKFTILPPAPTVSSYSDYDFTSNNNFQMTLNGVGFASVSSVSLQGTVSGSTNVNIVSQNDTVMVLSFPSSTVTRGELAFAYKAGTNTLNAYASQELVNVDAAYQIFANSNIAPGWGSWSWDNAQISNKESMTSASTWNAQYSANGWKIDGFREGGGGATDGLAYSPSYTYLVMWVYGGTAKETLYVEWGNEGFANGGGNEINALTVMPGVWNYFKVPIPTLLWNTSTTNWAANSATLLNTCAFFMNSNSVTEQLYFDDVVLVK